MANYKDTVTCRGCDQRKPRSDFELTQDKHGVWSPRKQCRVCNGQLGHKPCFTCKEDLPMERFSVVRKPEGLPYPRRDCMRCVYQNRKIAKAQPPKKTGPKPEPTYVIRPGRPGWTPPPTLEELAAIHRRYSPPEGFVYPAGELSA